MSIREKVVKRMRELEIPMSDAALYSNISMQKLEHWMKGKAEIPYKSLHNLMDLFSIESDELYEIQEYNARS